MLNSETLLDKLSYYYTTGEEPESEPETLEKTFSELFGISGAEGLLGKLLTRKIYMHQLRALQALTEGKNIILRAGTGSGKTEAWFIYAWKHRKKTLAIYPTLALASDQLKRIEDYSRNLGIKTARIDSISKEQLLRDGKKISTLRGELKEADIVVTNPAFMLMEIKRIATKPSSSILYAFLNNLDLIVIDEVDFYSPREIALLYSMLKILSEIRQKLQVAVLTAGISNPEELCAMLTETTSRECVVIEGKPFKRRNKYILVLGKNLEELWKFAQEHAYLLEEAGVGEDIKRSLKDFDLFKKNLYKIVEVFRALGVDVPSPFIDPVEIVSSYLEDDVVTVVFTRSIESAEDLYRKLRSRLSEKNLELVATHHHLVSKRQREEIEEKARKGEIKIIISPKTLAQGIDIGTIARIIHLGLPEDVREFYQKEGRKGRRLEQEFTESIIIPISRWDRELLSRGVDAFFSWVKSPLEITLINKDNKYAYLFYYLFKVKARQKLSRSEAEFLQSLGLLEGNKLTKRGEQAWYYINFYEYAPPFGVKRVFKIDSSEKYLEDVSFSDLVEKFQVGCFDYTSDGIVANIQIGGSKGRVVRKIEVYPLSEQLLYSHDALAYTIEEYKKTKIQWGEQPGLHRDFYRGLLRSEAVSNVIPPITGFGMYIKLPYKVLWIMESERGKVYDLSGKTLILHRRKVIEVPGFVAGRYSDFTYGELYELDSREDINKIRLGLAMLSVFLREKYNLPLWTFSYSLSSFGGRKTLVLWEEECAGYIEKLDWAKIYNEIDGFAPSDLSEIYLLQRDEEAHVEWVSLSGSWDLAKMFAKSVLEYILAKNKIRLQFGGKEFFVPKPGRHLKVLSMETLQIPLTETGEVLRTYICIYDGEEAKVSSFDKYYYKASGPVDTVNNTLMNLVNSGFKILVYDLDRVRSELHNSGLTYQAALLSGLIQLNLVIDLKQKAEEKFGSPATLLTIRQFLGSDAYRAIGVTQPIRLEDLELKITNLQLKVKNSRKIYPEMVSETYDEFFKKFVEENARIIYLLWLLLGQKEEQT